MAKLLESAGVKGRKLRRETSSTTPGMRSRRHVVTARMSAQDSREQLSIPVDRGVSGDLRFGVLIAV